MAHLYTSRKAIALILGFAVLSIALAACKDDDDGGTKTDDYAFRFKANGSQIELKLQGGLVAAFSQSGTIYNGVFTGSDGVSSITLQVFDNKTISEKTFSGYTIVGSSVIGALINYNAADGTGYSQGSVDPDATVIVTEITETTVRGNFHATVKATGKTDISITDGEFYVWRAN